MFVQSTIGERGRETNEFGIMGGNIFVGDIGLRNVDQFSRDACLVGNSYFPSSALSMRLARDDLDLVT